MYTLRQCLVDLLRTSLWMLSVLHRFNSHGNHHHRKSKMGLFACSQYLCLKYKQTLLIHIHYAVNLQKILHGNWSLFIHSMSMCVLLLLLQLDLGHTRHHSESGHLKTVSAYLPSVDNYKLAYRIHRLISAYAYFQNCKEICA